MSSLKPSKRILPLGLTVISITTLCIILLPHVRNLNSRFLGGPLTKCILYDRPPRTGSTTISQALGRCIIQKNYSVVTLKSSNRTSVITMMLSSLGTRLAAVKSHIAVSAHDLKLLKDRCGELLYITSCSPMKKRLYSAAKYGLAGGHGNTTLRGDRSQQINLWLSNNQWIESFLEAYPHVSEERTPLEVIPERMIPDYVIRSDSVENDLGELLQVLGCDSSFKSQNVHVTSFDESKVFSGIELEMEDEIYKWLIDVAEGNERGLEKAKGF